MGEKIVTEEVQRSVEIDKELYSRRREIEKSFGEFCRLKSGTEVDKLKMFVFAELARLECVILKNLTSVKANL